MVQIVTPRTRMQLVEKQVISFLISRKTYVFRAGNVRRDAQADVIASEKIIVVQNGLYLGTELSK